MPSLLEFCPRLRDNGSCLDPACRYSHILYNCDSCTFSSVTAAGLRQHERTRRHEKRKGVADVYLCPVCVNVKAGPKTWAAHCKSSKHLRRCNKQRILPEEVQPEIVKKTDGCTFCAPCDITVASRDWNSHINGKNHRKHEEWATLRNVLEEAEEDKNGVIVSGNFDFGYVESEAASAGTAARNGTVSTADATSQIILLDFYLVSSKRRKKYSSFKLSSDIVPGDPTPLTHTIGFSIAVDQPYAGRCQDRLEFIFKDQSSGSPFVIAKAICAIIGNKADHDRLGPVTPYTPPSRTARQPETTIIHGEPPSSKAIKYKSKLPLANIPADLKATLAQGTVGRILTKIQQSFLPQTLNCQTHGQHFKCLVWIEEYRQEEDMGRYDMSNVRLDSVNVAFRLAVPGLAEKRPSVLMGDRILVQPAAMADGHWFEGFVHAVELNTVLLHFHGSFRKGWSQDQLYYVRFKLNRHMIRREQHALESEFAEERVLFPTASHLPTTQYTDAASFPLPIVNLGISTNPRQIQAVVSILNLPRGAPPFIVFGPPGTGKTVTIVEAIRQILKKDPTARVFACAPSNSAADLIAMRLGDLGKDTLFRFYAPSRQRVQVPTALLEFACILPDGQFSAPPLDKMEQYRVVISTCGSSSFAHGLGMARGHFSHIFVDEAGQASEPEVMIAIRTLADSRANVILSGDPKQLGPVIHSAIARQLKLGESYLERLMTNGPYDVHANYGTSVVKLVKNFRSHNAILHFPNKEFYESELEPHADPQIVNSFLDSPYLPNGKFPAVFHGVQGKDEREATSPSFFNVEEILIVADYVKRLLADRNEFSITEEDIGVISPYYAQSRKIRTELKRVLSPDMKVKVDSVEGFQGQERRVIIISTVRSSTDFLEYDLKHTLGFVASPRRFNVAVTRAQALLIIVGDPTVLSLDPLWRSFLNYIHDNQGWTGSPITWDPTVPVNEAGGYDEQIRDAAASEMRDLKSKIEELTLANVEDGDGNIDRLGRNED